MAHKFSIQPPAHTMTAYPRMPPVEPCPSPFLMRVHTLVREWVQDEWLVIDDIKRNAHRLGGNAQADAAINDARLTPDSLAKRLDNMSRSSLFRELRKLNAPPPAEIIRKARMEFAKHLLTHTRMLVRDIAQRAGFPHEEYFTRRFAQECKCTPIDFRRAHIETTTTPKKSASPRKKAGKD